MSVEILNRLTHMEQAMHRNGWDKPPSLHLMYLRGSSRMTHVPNPPGVALEFLAKQMVEHADQSELRPLLLRTVERGVLAVVFACEVWVNDEFASDEEREADRRDLADIPGSREARLVSAAGADGAFYMVNRIRGEKPVAESFEPLAAGRPTGRVPEALAQIMDVMRAAVPSA